MCGYPSRWRRLRNLQDDLAERNHEKTGGAGSRAMQRTRAILTVDCNALVRELWNVYVPSSGRNVVSAIPMALSLVSFPITEG